MLAAALVSELEGQHWHFGPTVERFLRERDSEALGPQNVTPLREIHATTIVTGPTYDPWYEVTDRLSGAVLYRGRSRGKAEAVAARHPQSLLVGSEWLGSEILG